MISPAPDPILAALRYPQDGAQVIRAIAAIAAVDPGFARRFVGVVLEGAIEGGSERDRAREFYVTNPPPDALECRRGAQLFSAEGRLVLGWRTGRLGSVDLRFAGAGDFALNLDLRLHGRLSDDERERYRRSGEPLLVILADPVATADRSLERNSNWLGTVAWDDLLGPLAGISELPSWRWLTAKLGDELYGGEEGEAGGDWRELLEAARTPILDQVRDAVRRTARDLEPAKAAELAGPTGEVPDGGELCIQVPSRPDGWIFVALSGRTEEPTLRVAWEPLGSSKPLRAKVQALRAAEPLYELSKHGVARSRPLDPPSEERLLAELRLDLEVLSRHGLLAGHGRRTG